MKESPSTTRRGRRAGGGEGRFAARGAARLDVGRRFVPFFARVSTGSLFLSDATPYRALALNAIGDMCRATRLEIIGAAVSAYVLKWAVARWEHREFFPTVAEERQPARHWTSIVLGCWLWAEEGDSVRSSW